MTYEQMLEKLRVYVAGNPKSKAELARSWGIKRQYLHSILIGDKPIKNNILDTLGYEKAPDRYIKKR